MKRFPKPVALLTSGDTIVEVLIALTIISLSLSISYATANRSLLGSRQAQEHSEALELVQSQLEQLRAAAPSASDVFTSSSHVQGFCVSSGNIVDIGTTPAGCTNGRYKLSINAIDTIGTFMASAQWDSVVGGGQDEVSLNYRLPTATASSSSPTSTPVLVTCAQVNSYVTSRGGVFYDLTTRGSDWHVYYHHVPALPPHPQSSVPLNIAPSMAAGSYNIWFSTTDTAYNALADNLSVHYIGYATNPTFGSPSPVFTTTDTPDLPRVQGPTDPAVPESVQENDITLGAAVNFLMVQHAADAGGNDDSVDAGCFAYIQVS